MRETICGHQPHEAKGLCKKYYMREYNQRPYVKERKREYYQRPDVKERKREYYQRPDVKERKREYYHRPDVKERMKEAQIISDIRREVKTMSKEALDNLLYEIRTEEGDRFAEMVLDGIPKRRGIEFEYK